jgi:predicted amidohydrolase YtcJ
MPLDALVTGRIATFAGVSGFGWVEAVGIKDGRVAFAGSAIELETRADPFTVRHELDLDEVAIPGLTDAHLHLADGGIALEQVDLETSRTLDDGLGLIAAAHGRLPDGEWIEGHGWDPDRWGRWPTAEDLDRVAPGRRVALWAHDHHSLWVSGPALELAGIDRETADPPGGIIRRADDRAATGVLHEGASRLVTDRVPRPSEDRYERLIATLARQLVAVGVVAVHDPGALALQTGLGPSFAAYRRLAARGTLPLRVHVCIREEQLAAAAEAGLRSGDRLSTDGERARLGWMKLFADGTLASRTAALLDPIETEPGRPLPAGTERGVFITPPERQADLAVQAADVGIATIIHAIGDHAVRAALDALEPTAGRTPLMPRLEHVQLLHPDDRGRFASSGIAASVQPVHLRADASAARRLWGDRAERNGYTWRTLVDSGAVVAFGTDAPVEPIDPWPGLSMAVTRSDPSWPAGTAPFGPDEALTLERALRAACVAPPLTAGERDRGRLVPGQRADLVVLPIEALIEPVVPGGALATARPRLVLVDGQVGYEA